MTMTQLPLHLNTGTPSYAGDLLLAR